MYAELRADFASVVDAAVFIKLFFQTSQENYFDPPSGDIYLEHNFTKAVCLQFSTLRYIYLTRIYL